MKARIKATGYIIEVCHDPQNPDLMIGESGLRYNKKILEIIDDPDYWTRLEHTYAGMAMQGILTNPIGFENIRARGGNIQIETALLASEFAHALVEKMKEERK